MGRRIQLRRSNGKFTRNTTEQAFGLHVKICKHCGQLLPYNLAEPPPETCHRCGKPTE